MSQVGHKVVLVTHSDEGELVIESNFLQELANRNGVVLVVANGSFDLLDKSQLRGGFNVLEDQVLVRSEEGNNGLQIRKRAFIGMEFLEEGNDLMRVEQGRIGICRGRSGKFGTNLSDSLNRVRVVVLEKLTHEFESRLKSELGKDSDHKLRRDQNKAVCKCTSICIVDP